MKWFLALTRWAAHGGALLLALCLVLRLMHYDRDGRLLALRYATPWPVLAALAFALAAFWWIGRRRLLSALFVLAALAAGIAWMSSSYRLHAPRRSTDPLRVAYWNIGGPERSIGAVIKYLQTLNADVIGIAELDVRARRAHPLWSQRFPGKSVTPLSSGMLLVAEGRVLEQRAGFLGNAGRYHQVVLQVRGREITVLLVDFDSAVTRSRASAFRRLGELVAAHGKEPLIVMGDFNTPIDSPHFEILRASLRDAFETAGRGFAETWPVPLPLLSLDHVWVNAPLRVAGCKLGWSSLSDHRPVVAEIEFEAGALTKQEPGARASW